MVANHHLESNESSHVATAEHNIERDLEKNPGDYSGVFHELNQLRKSDPQGFKDDLNHINEDLHRGGYLPNMQIVDTGDGNYSVVADSPNPKKQAVVSTSESAPKESAAERQNYQKMGYNGWSDSTPGGGGASGGYDGRAVAGEVPQGSQLALIQQALELAIPGFAQMSPQQQQQLEAAVNTIVTHENGWNPNAINLTDSNAAAGHPSQGLMQTIPSTFKEYAMPGYNSNIDDPLSNLVVRHSIC